MSIGFKTNVVFSSFQSKIISCSCKYHLRKIQVSPTWLHGLENHTFPQPVELSQRFRSRGFLLTSQEDSCTGRPSRSAHSTLRVVTPDPHSAEHYWPKTIAIFISNFKMSSQLACNGSDLYLFKVHSSLGYDNIFFCILSSVAKINLSVENNCCSFACR